MKSALILGATSDIAQALAKKLAIDNYELVLAARNMSSLKAIQSDLQIRYDAQVAIAEFDATDFKSHPTFYSSLTQKPPITIAAFGYLGNQSTAAHNWEESLKIIQSNLTGAVSILNIVADHYEEAQNGIIVGISSVAGERGRGSNYLYGSAKAGFTAYLSGLRNRLFSSGAHVVTVKPGFVATKMTEGLDLPKKLTATPEQVAKAIHSALKRRKNVVYVLPVWRMIMFIIKHLPEMLFKRLSL